MDINLYVMKQEDKQLLIRDLCARLPYGVICQMEDKLIINESPYYDYTLSERHLDLFRNHQNFYIKPYLRPMSSMTEEEKNEYLNTFKKSIIGTDEEDGRVWTVDSIDWLNAHHFDYRGLIEKGLAIAVTEENNPYKK